MSLGSYYLVAAAGQVDQKEVWKAHKPKKGDTAPWWQIANALTKKRMYARDASFGDDLARAYGVEWVEDLFAPADQDGLYTTNVEGFLGPQHEWMTANVPKRGAILEVNSWGQPELPKKACQVYGKRFKSDQTALVSIGMARCRRSITACPRRQSRRASQEASPPRATMTAMRLPCRRFAPTWHKRAMT